MRSLIVVIVNKKWELFQLEVNNAFLHGDLHDKIYMKTPPGLVIHDRRIVCKLKKSRYCLKQASIQWYSKLLDALQFKGYQHSKNDYSLFFKKTNEIVIFLAIYVDDIIMTGNNIEVMSQLKDYLDQQFKIKDLGHLNYF